MATKPLKLHAVMHSKLEGGRGTAALRWSGRCCVSPRFIEQFDDRASFARLALEREAPRSAVIRPAGHAWFNTLEGTDPTPIVAMLRAARVARRRRPR
jgi:hypothetical protein